MAYLSGAWILFALLFSWTDLTVGDECLSPELYTLYLSKSETLLPDQFSDSALKTVSTDTTTGNMQLTCFTFGNNQEYEYTVTLDSITGLLTVEYNGNLYLVINNKNAKSVIVKNAVIVTPSGITEYYTTNSDGDLCRAYIDSDGNVQLQPVTRCSSSANGLNKGIRQKKRLTAASSLKGGCYKKDEKPKKSPK